MSKSEQQKNKIIAIASELFATIGFEATTTRKINQRDGIAEGLLYYYFPHGKREILDTIVRGGVEQRLVVFDPSSTVASANAEQRLIALFDRIWDSFVADRGYQAFIIMVRERALLSAEQSKWLIESMQQIGQRLSVILQGAPNFESFPPQDLADLAAIIAALFQRTVYDELLIGNHRQLPAGVRDRVLRQLHLILTMATQG